MIYKFLAEGKFRNFSIDKEIETIKKYGLMNTENSGHNFIAYEHGDTIDIYYGNIHFQRIHNHIENSLKIFIKFPEDVDWSFEDNNRDYAHPLNEVYKVYFKCSIAMVDDGVYESDVYKSGTWDKYVFRASNNFEKEVSAVTDTSRFNASYKKS